MSSFGVSPYMISFSFTNLVDFKIIVTISPIELILSGLVKTFEEQTLTATQTKGSVSKYTFSMQDGSADVDVTLGNIHTHRFR